MLFTLHLIVFPRALDVWGSPEALARERKLRKVVEQEYQESRCRPFNYTRTNVLIQFYILNILVLCLHLINHIDLYNETCFLQIFIEISSCWKNIKTSGETLRWEHRCCQQSFFWSPPHRITSKSQNQLVLIASSWFPESFHGVHPTFSPHCVLFGQSVYLHDNSLLFSSTALHYTALHSTSMFTCMFASILRPHIRMTLHWCSFPICCLLNACFFFLLSFKYSLDQTWGQRFYKVQGKWLWSLFVCKLLCQWALFPY